MAVKKLGDVLIEQGVIRPEQLELALEEQRRSGKRLGVILGALGFATEAQITRALAQQSLVSVDLATLTPDLDAISLVPGALAWQHKLVPLEIDEREGTIAVAIANPQNTLALDELELTTKHF